MSLTRIPLPRKRRSASVRWKTTNGTSALLILGIVCWGTLGARQLAKLAIPNSISAIDAAAQQPSPKWVYIEPQRTVDPKWELECARQEPLPVEFAENSDDLTLEMTHVSPSRQTAIINGVPVTEGLSTKLGGVQVRVESIAAEQVMLAIRGSIVRLPLARKTEMNDGLGRITDTSTEPFVTTQNQTVEADLSNFR